MTFKRINYSEIDGYSLNETFPAGTVVIDENNQLKMHDGTTQGGSLVGGATPMPHATSPINIQDPDVSLGAIRVMMTSGVVNILSSQSADMALLYTGRVVTAAGVQTIISSSGTSVSAGQQATLGTLANRGDTLIIDNIYDANSSTIYRITAMITWSGSPNGTVIIEQLF